MENDKDIFKANDKTKVMWNIVKSITLSRNFVENLVLNHKDRKVNDPGEVASLFLQPKLFENCG